MKICIPRIIMAGCEELRDWYGVIMRYNDLFWRWKWIKTHVGCMALKMVCIYLYQGIT